MNIVKEIKNLEEETKKHEDRSDQEIQKLKYGDSDELNRIWCFNNPAYSWFRVFGLAILHQEPIFGMLMCQLWDHPSLLLWPVNPFTDLELIHIGY